MFRKAMTRLGFAALRLGLTVPAFQLSERFYELAYLRDILNRLRVNVVFDVGANKGWYSKHVRMMGYEGEIFSFEPIAADCQAIRQLAQGDPKWHVCGYALGAEDTERAFNIVTGGDSTTVLSSFLEPRTASGAMTSETVRLVRLDAVAPGLLAKIDRPRIFLKIDTQGFDLEVLKGARATLPQCVGMQSEISVTPIYHGMPHYTKALDLYEQCGFRLMNLFVIKRAAKQSVLEYDCIMARLEELDR